MKRMKSKRKRKSKRIGNERNIRKWTEIRRREVMNQENSKSWRGLNKGDSTAFFDFTFSDFSAPCHSYLLTC